MGYSGVSPSSVGPLVDGTIFTRAPKDKKNTAIFIGGGDMQAGEAVLNAVKGRFFGDFRVSVMLDSNGGNTTSAALVAKLLTSGSVLGKRAVILAGTGPVGRRTAALLAREGASEIVITSRQILQAKAAAADIKSQFKVDVIPLEARDNESRRHAIEGAQVLVATGATGIQLLEVDDWIHSPTLELIADANATPPLGIGGIEVMDRGLDRGGKKVWGAIGFGALKLSLHRACIAKLFESNALVLNAEEIFTIAKSM